MNILLVDDTATIRNLVAAMLKRMGYEVQSAKDGTEAWALLQERTFDLLLTDWNMPQMSGLELVQQVRSTSELDALPIIMLTTRGNKDDIVDALKAGVDNYATKPVTPDELRDKIDKVLKKKRAANEG